MVQQVWRRMPYARLMAWLRAAASALWQPIEPVELVEQRFNFLPQRFRWRGGLWSVRQVIASWDAAGRAPRRYFAVVCQNGAHYLLFQDLQVGSWHLSAAGGAYVPLVV